MFGLFEDYNYLESKIKLLQEEFFDEQRKRINLENKVFSLKKQLKNIEEEKYKELEKSYEQDANGTLKVIYDKYKYKKAHEVPCYIKEFIAIKCFIDLNKEERTLGEILELNYRDMWCIGCEKDKKERGNNNE